MNLYSYEVSSIEDKIKWLNSFKIMSGLRYFGGKAFIGKYLVNHVLNMAVKMERDGNRAEIFVDGFAGGGKIALSMPEGVFDSIILNDINYGVCSYFEYCKENPKALVQMIETLGEVMSEDIFLFCAYCRSNDGLTDKKKKADKILKSAKPYLNQMDKLNATRKELIHRKGLTDLEIEILEKPAVTEEERIKSKELNLSFEERKLIRITAILQETKYIQKIYELIEDERVEPLVSAAMTYWVTQVSFNGVTEPKKVSYRLGMRDNKSGLPTKGNEKEDIEKVVNHARKHVKLVHEKMVKLNIIVENLDYREVIKKYNGMEYQTLTGRKEQEENFKSKNKLFYFDPPYHEATLNGGEAAPYEDTFPLEMTREMTKILHGDFEQIYGKILYFLKSDYSPKYTYFQFKDQLKEAKEQLQIEQNKLSNDTAIGSDESSERAKKIASYKSYIKRMEKQLDSSLMSYHDFDVLEDNVEFEEHEANTENPVFYKIDLGEFDKGAVGDDGTKLKGREYLWGRGNYIKDNNILFFSRSENNINF